MAFRSRRRRGGYKRPKIKTRWTGDYDIDQVAVGAGALSSLTLLATTDYEVNALLEEGGGARLERIVGALTVFSVNGLCEFTAGIMVVDAAAGFSLFGGVNDTSVFNTIRNGDLVWWTCGIAPNTAGGMGPLRIPWDIRVRRRLENSVVFFSITNNAAVAMTHHVGFRMLLANA